MATLKNYGTNEYPVIASLSWPIVVFTLVNVYQNKIPKRTVAEASLKSVTFGICANIAEAAQIPK